MKIYIHHETGSAYIIKNGAVLHQPLFIGNQVIDTDKDIEWGEVEYDLVGDETVSHEGRTLTIKELEPIIRAKLA